IRCPATIRRNAEATPWRTTQAATAPPIVPSTSRPQQRLAAHPDHVAVDRTGRRIRIPGNGFRDVYRQPTLTETGQSAASFTDDDRHLRGHLGLDEPRRDGVDRAAVPRERARGILHHADHACLAGRVVRLADVAR